MNDNIEINIEHVLYYHHKELINILENIRKDLQNESFRNSNAQTHQEKLDAWRPYCEQFYSMSISDLDRILLKYPRGE